MTKEPYPMKSIITLGPKRSDATALGFGLAFIVFGVLGLLRASGADVPLTWIYPTLLIGLGAAGLASLLTRGPR
jgi:hypothetical protein